MILAVVHFPVATLAPRQQDAAEDAMLALLGCWRRNGQIVGHDLPLAKNTTGYAAAVLVPAPDSLARRFWTEEAVHRLAALHEAGGADPLIREMGVECTSGAPCQCKRRQALLLHTTYLWTESPLRCLTCFRPIPLYEVLLTQQTTCTDLIAWQHDYQACDSLQMNCTVGERFATRQLAALGSALTVQGRALCTSIEQHTKLPTYYYLYRGTGRSVRAERARTCPSCGDAWLLPAPLHERFDFRCDHCRLLSNVAWSVRMRQM